MTRCARPGNGTNSFCSRSLGERNYFSAASVFLPPRSSERALCAGRISTGLVRAPPLKTVMCAMRASAAAIAASAAAISERKINF